MLNKAVNHGFLMKNSFSSLSDLASALGHDIETKASTDNQSNEDLVYSTETGRIKAKKQSKSISESDGFAKVRREIKGRKGKGVITITGLGLAPEELKTLAKKLKKTCGTGGTVIDETIEIQGDKRDVIKQVLEKEGFKVKFIGG